MHCTKQLKFSAFFDFPSKPLCRCSLIPFNKQPDNTLRKYSYCILEHSNFLRMHGCSIVEQIFASYQIDPIYNLTAALFHISENWTYYNDQSQKWFSVEDYQDMMLKNSLSELSFKFMFLFAVISMCMMHECMSTGTHISQKISLKHCVL